MAGGRGRTGVSGRLVRDDGGMAQNDRCSRAPEGSACCAWQRPGHGVNPIAMAAAVTSVTFESRCQGLLTSIAWYHSRKSSKAMLAVRSQASKGTRTNPSLFVNLHEAASRCERQTEPVIAGPGL